MPDGGGISGPMMATMLGSSLIGAGGSIFGGMMGQSGAKNAVATEQGMFNQAARYASPFMKMGKNAINPLMGLITPGPDQTKNLEATPGYQFALSQGEKGVTNQATMGGLGGNVLRAGGGFASGLAQQTWSDVVNKLMTAVQTGSSAASSLAGNATSMGGKMGDTMMQGTNLGVGGLLGAAGSMSSGMNNLGTLSFLSKYLNNKSGGRGSPDMYGGE
jgi:hypothetical protein